MSGATIFLLPTSMSGGDAKVDPLALTGQIQRPEQPVPERENVSEVLVHVAGLGAVVHLVQGRAHEDVLQTRTPREPHVRMLQIETQREGHEQTRVDAQHGDAAHLTAGEIGDHAEEDVPGVPHEQPAFGCLASQARKPSIRAMAKRRPMA